MITSGFIAQELQQVLTDENVSYTGIVDTSDPENLTVSKEALIPMLVNAVQELSAENTALKARLDAAGLW